jgi:sugar phosphate permease
VITLYECGTFAGSIILNYLSDKTEGSKRSPIALVSILIGFAISMSFVIWYGVYPFELWLIALFAFGFFNGSIHHLFVITTAADLGRKHGKRATSTITGIIDGIGSIGNGLCQVFMGVLVEMYGWRYGFLLPVSISVGLTVLPLTRILANERKETKLAKEKIKQANLLE